jgi:hypothetical protein
MHKPTSLSSLLLLSTLALLTYTPTHARPNLADSKRGDPNSASPTRSDPPNRLAEDLAYNRLITDQEWITPYQAVITNTNILYYTYGRAG